MIAVAFRFLVPFFRENLPGIWGPLLAALVIILFISPFLRAIMIKKNHSVEFVTLWRDSRGNRAPLVATIVLRILLAVSFVMFVIAGLFKLSVGYGRYLSVGAEACMSGEACISGTGIAGRFPAFRISGS